MLELFLESIRTKASRGVKLAELGTMQMRIAEASAELVAGLEAELGTGLTWQEKLRWRADPRPLVSSPRY